MIAGILTLRIFRAKPMHVLASRRPMDRRFLITVGQPVCTGFGCTPLARVPGDVVRIGRYFSSSPQNYQWVLKSELALGTPSDSLRLHLSTWFAHPDRSSEDCVLLYW